MLHGFSSCTTASKMEFPTDEWDIFESADFDSAAPRGTGAAHMELMMQLRPNGRIQDHFRVAMGGSILCKAKIGLGCLLPTVDLQRIQLSYDFWVTDVVLRRNMTTSDWLDVYESIKSNKMLLLDRAGALLPEVDRAAILIVLESSDPLLKSASVRFAVSVGPDNRMRLELQGLPGPAKTISSKPAFTG